MWSVPHEGVFLNSATFCFDRLCCQNVICLCSNFEGTQDLGLVPLFPCVHLFLAFFGCRPSFLRHQPMLGRESQVVDILTIISLSLSTSQAYCRAPRPFRHSMLWTIVGQPSRLLHQTRPWARQNKLTAHVVSQLFFVPHPFVYLTLTVKTVERSPKFVSTDRLSCVLACSETVATLSLLVVTFVRCVAVLSCARRYCLVHCHIAMSVCVEKEKVDILHDIRCHAVEDTVNWYKFHISYNRTHCTADGCW